MTIAIDEQNIFRTVPKKSQAKGDVTNEAARGIIRVEAERQFAKTMRLREARLAFEALLPPALPEAKACVRKTDREKLTARTSVKHKSTL